MHEQSCLQRSASTQKWISLCHSCKIQLNIYYSRSFSYARSTVTKNHSFIARIHLKRLFLCIHLCIHMHVDITHTNKSTGLLTSWIPSQCQAGSSAQLNEGAVQYNSPTWKAHQMTIIPSSKLVILKNIQKNSTDLSWNFLTRRNPRKSLLSTKAEVYTLKIHFTIPWLLKCLIYFPS